MTLQYISFGLALLLGLFAFGLVKRTADEYDRWYAGEASEPRSIRRPVAMISLAVVAVATVLFLAREP